MHAIVLGAGLGRRVGGRKARLLVEGEMLIVHHVRRARSAGFAPLVVAHPDDRAEFEGLAQVAVSTAPDQAGSLAVGVRALPADAEVVLVTPVDVLPASDGTLRGMLGVLTADVLAVTPICEGKGGHPVLVRRSVLDAYADAQPPLRDVLSALGARRVRWETDDRSVLGDLDDPQRVLEATGALPRFG
jgi:CTP:molybdopterin cytidylyltransferase MocA